MCSEQTDVRFLPVNQQRFPTLGDLVQVRFIQDYELVRVRFRKIDIKFNQTRRIEIESVNIILSTSR